MSIRSKFCNAYINNKKCGKEVSTGFRHFCEEHITEDYIKYLEHSKILGKIYYENNKEKIIQNAKKYLLKNKEKIKQYRKEYKNKNKEQINKKQRENYKDNFNVRLSRNLRNRIWFVLKGINKSKKTFGLLGCNIEELKNHLEKQFTKGMNWGNYGYYGWHVDHIIPCSSFNLTKTEEQLKCFNHTNLQPLWAKDNFEKGGRYFNG